MMYDNSMDIIAGDDITLKVDFFFNNEAGTFEDNDTAEMLIHDGDEEIIIPSKLRENNTAFFYISSDLTQSLLREGESESYYDYCIRVNWANRGRHTPIHRKMLTVKRC